jgi:hypothetical protein
MLLRPAIPGPSTTQGFTITASKPSAIPRWTSNSAFALLIAYAEELPILYKGFRLITCAAVHAAANGGRGTNMAHAAHACFQRGINHIRRAFRVHRHHRRPIAWIKRNQRRAVVEVLHTMHGIAQGVHLEQVAFHPLDPLKTLSTVRVIVHENPLDDGRIAAFPQQCAHIAPLR